MNHKMLFPAGGYIIILLLGALVGVVGAWPVFNDWNRDTGEEALVWATAEDCDLFTGRQTAKGETLLEPDSNITKRQLANVLYRYEQAVTSGGCRVSTPTTTAPATTTASATTTSTTLAPSSSVLWSADLSSSDNGGTGHDQSLGYKAGRAGALSDTTFTYDSVDYTVAQLFSYRNSVRFDTGPAVRNLPDGTVLRIVSKTDMTDSFTGRIGDARNGPNDIDYRWPIGGLKLEPGTIYAVSLVLPATPPTTTTVEATTTTTLSTQYASGSQRFSLNIHPDPTGTGYEYQMVWLTPREDYRVDLRTMVVPPSGNYRWGYSYFAADGAYRVTTDSLTFRVHPMDRGKDLRPYVSIYECKITIFVSSEVVAEQTSNHQPWRNPEEVSSITLCSLELDGESTTTTTTVTTVPVSDI